MFQLGQDTLTSDILFDLSLIKSPKLQVSEDAWARLEKYRAIVMEKANSKEKIYGLNTGFGFLSNVSIDKEKLEQLQYNLVRSHACGVGDPVDAQIARACLILRAHTFLMGYSGISRAAVEQILTFISHDILPVIPAQGSVGASGDLAPLAHLAMGLMGEGEVHFEGKLQDADKVLKDLKIEPLKLGPKEGLSLINGTHFMSAIAAVAVKRAKVAMQSADVATALSLDAIRGSLAAFDERIQNIRPQVSQATVAKNIRNIYAAKDSEIMGSHVGCDKVQDPYSFRCVPQVHGACRDTLIHCEQVVNRELNAVTDNPLVFEDGSIISGGNFHGEPIAMVMDFLAIAVAEIGSISERRIEKITNPNLSGLPAFVIKDSGLNSGFMIPHVVAAALVSENKVLSHPASVDSIPTSADKEDHVSMGPIAARKCLKILDNTFNILSIEFLTAIQGIDLLEPLKTASPLEAVRSAIRAVAPRLDCDRSLHKEIKTISQWIEDGKILIALKQNDVTIH